MNLQQVLNPRLSLGALMDCIQSPDDNVADLWQCCQNLPSYDFDAQLPVNRLPQARVPFVNLVLVHQAIRRDLWVVARHAVKSARKPMEAVGSSQGTYLHHRFFVPREARRPMLQSGRVFCELPGERIVFSSYASCLQRCQAAAAFLQH